MQACLHNAPGCGFKRRRAEAERGRQSMMRGFTGRAFILYRSLACWHCSRVGSGLSALSPRAPRPQVERREGAWQRHGAADQDHDGQSTRRGDGMGSAPVRRRAVPERRLGGRTEARRHSGPRGVRVLAAGCAWSRDALPAFCELGVNAGERPLGADWPGPGKSGGHPPRAHDRGTGQRPGEEAIPGRSR